MLFYVQNLFLAVGIFVILPFCDHLVLSYNGTLCTIGVCKIEESTLRFFHVGDWGGQDTAPFVTPAQKTVATTMNKMGDDRRVHFVLSIGDHFYPIGPKFVNDSRFRTTFDDVFTFGKADHVPWYMSAGNHDYYGDVQSQLDYHHVNPRWVYPSLSYVVRYELAPTKTTIDIVFVDTVVLCGETWYGGVDPKSGRYKNALDLPTGPEDPVKADALWSWVENQLRQSRADYLFVATHYPIFSAGHHGDFTCPRNRMQALLEKYNVTAYLCGHDHNLQHLKSIGSQGLVVHHILSGGGNSLDKRTRQLNAADRANVSSEFFFPKPSQHRLPNTDNVGGFVYAELERSNGTFWFYSGDGHVLYQLIVHPRPATNKVVPILYYSNFPSANCCGVEGTSKAVLFSAALFLIWYV